MKTLCIYHSIDLDGWMSAAIVKLWSGLPAKDNEGGQFDFIGYNYGQPIPDMTYYTHIIMVDISFPKEKMRELGYTHSITYIDHHISAIKDMEDSAYTSYNGLRDVKFAACELTWKYYFPNDSMPEIVRLLGRYDCFGHKGTNEELKVLEFQYGARMVISNYEEAYTQLIKCTRVKESNYWFIQAQVVVGTIHEQGKAIYKFLCTEAKQSYKNGFELLLNEPIYDINLVGAGFAKRKFICINKERFNPINFGIDYHKDGYDGCACFHYANNMWNFSLYNDNGLVDCSLIAKTFGGGGHKGASGFKINDINSIYMKS